MSANLRDIGGIQVYCTISEHHNDTQVITEHPVEVGAPISDHKYLNPTRVEITVAAPDQSDGAPSMQQFYAQFLQLMAQDSLFSITTGKRQYVNQQIESIEESTDVNSENICKLIIRCREVILVYTDIYTAAPSAQSNAPTTAAPAQQGAKQPVPATGQPSQAASVNNNPIPGVPTMTTIGG